MLAPDGRLAPNFWRAGTDNEYGADVPRKRAVWRDPAMTLTSFDAKMQDGKAVVSAVYLITCPRYKLSQGSHRGKVAKSEGGWKKLEEPNFHKHNWQSQTELDFKSVQLTST